MRSNLLHGATVAAILVTFVAPTGSSSAGEGPKELAYQVVDRNAEQMAKIGDSIYYFAELGMQEFESAPASVPGVLYHHWAAAVTPTSTIAHKGMVVGAKVLAASVLDLMTSAELRAKARAQFEDDTRDTKYFSLMPPDAKPPLDLNKAMMDQYRPAMSKFYLNATPRLQ